MTNYDKRIQPSDHDPYENITVNPIEKNKKDKEEFSKSGQEITKSQIFAALLSYFKKLTSLFSFKDRNTVFQFDFDRLLEHLWALRAQLSILTQRDESYNPIFTQQLTELWHKLMDDCNSIPSLLGNSSETLKDIKSFIAHLSSYPLGADHSLNYYFNAYAGKDWIPFPFMQILYDLHQEHQIDPTTSHLTQWLSHIDAILSEQTI